MPASHLQGRTILITRPQPEASATAQQVLACHGKPLLAPALTILPPQDAGALRQALQHPQHYRGILVTSVNGARAIVAAMPPASQPPPFFAVGAQTATILQKEGWSVQIPAVQAGGEALAQAVIQWEQSQPATPATAGASQKTFLLPQAEQGREALAVELQQAGYGVEKVVAYRAEPLTALPAEVESALAAGRVDAVLFFSGRSAQAFVATLTPTCRAALAASCIAVISPVTAEAVQQLGFTVTVTARQPNSTALLAALHQHWHGAGAA
ncbi:MAG: uroporphyrinogen-III synthase [Magnetococcales bacterium]|nr:uroporphyrinogen-III synthase [Magnetococcales bacterium]